MKKVKVRKESASKKSYFSFYSEKWIVIQKVIKVGILTLAFLFSLNSYGAVNILDCNSSNSTLKNYNEILEAQKNNLKPGTRYTLGFIAICIGRYDDGLTHMRRASEGGHVAATRILGKYYKNNQSFDNAQKLSMENRYTAITYYEKAADQIKSMSSYPRPDMEYLEYVNAISYRIFTALPGLYFNTYNDILEDIIVNGAIYSNTLEILQKMGDAATNCLRRPALSTWKEKKDLVYKTQQIECQAYLDFVKAIYPLEDERLQIANNCTASVANCKKHKEILNPMGKEINTLLQELKKSPGLVVQHSQ